MPRLRTDPIDCRGRGALDLLSPFTLPDRSFVAVWKQALPSARVPGLRARRFDESGVALGPDHGVTEGPDVIREFVGVGTTDGAMALWETTVDTLPQRYGIALRPLDLGGRPRGETRVLTELGFYQSGLSATFARGDVLAAGVVGSVVLRPVVIPLSPDGGSRGDFIPLLLPAGSAQIGGLRIITTSMGALVVYTTDPMAYPNRLVAVPISCSP